MAAFNLSRQALQMRVKNHSSRQSIPAAPQIGCQRAAGRSCGFRPAGYRLDSSIVYIDLLPSDVTREDLLEHDLLACNEWPQQRSGFTTCFFANACPIGCVRAI